MEVFLFVCFKTKQLCYLCSIPRLVLKGSCQDIVREVKYKQAYNEQRASKSPHCFPVPV